MTFNHNSQYEPQLWAYTWLERIMLKFQYTIEGSDSLNVRESIRNLWKDVDMSVRTKRYFEVWHVRGRILEWHTNWPKTYAALAKA